MEVTVRCFAQLKEFFPPQVELNIRESANVELVCQELVASIAPARRQDALKLLAVCQASVGEELVTKDCVLSKKGVELCLLPPPSGG